MSAPRTPGPWAYLDIGEIVSTDPMDDYPTNYVICVVAGPEHPNADGSLIAAAPELYASLIELLEPLERASAELVAHGKAADENAEAAFDRARAALAKARGER